MPRKPRFYLPGVPVHVVQRGNNREVCFFDESDYQCYLVWLKEGAERYGNAIHAYVLMTNHVHILITPGGPESLMRMMQYVGRHYVMHVNRTYGRSGTLWEGRYKASLVQEEGYLLACYRYIELNPIRAGVVQSPGQYYWSSYRYNGLGRKGSFVTPHDIYKGLGADEVSRRKAYRELLKDCAGEDELPAIRAAWQTGTPLGNGRFVAQIEAAIGRKVGQSRRGRPSKE